MPQRLTILDIRIRALPFEDVAVIVGTLVGTEPSIFPVVPAQACFNLTGLPRSQYGTAIIHEPTPNLLLKRHSPAPIRCLFRQGGRRNPASAD